ncbi:MAG: 16S rRNA (guanine(966)-N(2))-methyltransferase RsmD [Steroidobacter sp.]
MARVVSKKTAARATPANRLRIIGGRWRGAPIVFPPVEAVRPSPDRVRETLFNWLQSHVLAARCLDLFAGSGALGFEALSRGAAQVTFVDREPQLARHLKQTLERLGSAAGAVFTEDARRFLQRPAHPFDIVFLDPPFASGDMLQEVCNALAHGWLADEAWVYIECPADAALPLTPHGWTVHRSRRAGQVGYHLLSVRTPS